LRWLPWDINNPNSQFRKAHLTTLNLYNFKIIEAMGLKKLLRGDPLEWHYLRTRVHEILLSRSKVIMGATQPDTQTDGLVIW
jgi:hypothetical protein